MKKFISIISSIFFILSLTVSCSNTVNDSNNDLLLFNFLQQQQKNSSSQNQLQYADLTVAVGNSSGRALDIASISKADVEVLGYGMSKISRQDVAVSSGTSSSADPVVIENIPVGNNRIVTVQAKENISNVLTAMAGVKISAVTNIESGSNTVNVNWSSTAVGNIYAALLDLNYDISLLSSETVSGYLPKDGSGKIIHASLINSAKLAADIKNNSVIPGSSSYELSAGQVSFTSDASSGSITVQVCDPISSKLNSVSAGSNTISNVAPGTWKVFGLYGNSVVFSKSVTVGAGESVDLGSILFKVPAPRLEDASGMQIGEFISGTKTVYLKARTYDDEEELDGVTIYYTTDGTEPTSSSSLYTASGINVNVGTKIKAIAVRTGLLDSDVSTWEFSKPKIGYTHPASGKYSPVDMNSSTDGFGWSSGDWALGANVNATETTFALYSANATKILLEIYSSPYGTDAMYDYWMEKDSNNVWRAKISGNLTGAIYAFRCWGPNWIFSESWTRGGSSEGCVADYDSNGNRFNPNKIVFDPYAREMTHDPSNADAISSYATTNESYALAAPEYQILSTGETKPAGSTKSWREFDSGTIAPKGYIITDNTSYGTKPAIAQKDAIIYEAHVRGLTNHSSTANLSTLLSGYVDMENIPAEYRGTYKGATYMIPYLKMLGINTIELLPVHETDNDANPDDGPGGNFWGYMTFDYFAPDRRYSSDKTAGGPTKEFKEMIKAFHDAGMEVYLDVVYNHAGEGGTWHGSDKDENFDQGKQCTVVSMRGIDNSTYYTLCTTAKAYYWDSTGCGNNLKCDNPVVRQLILDSLTYWIDEMGADGFRFDLATVLGREESNYTDDAGNKKWNYSSSAQTLVDIATLGSSKNVEMIAESWDCGEYAYQVGNFPAGWAGWNGRYRDTMRKFVGYGARNGASYGDINNFINGDYDNFNKEGGPHKTVNFIVAHDGYTLADLCSGYTTGGEDYNKTLTWPFGPSDGGDSSGALNGFGNEAANKRQAVRNMFALQMISRGVPMIVYGDEFGRTQNGNNNPYNVDSVCTWNNYNMVATSSPHTVSTDAVLPYHNNFGTFGNTAGKNGNFEFARYMMNLHASEPAFRQDTYTVGYNFRKEDGSSILQDDDRCVWIRIDGDTVTGGSDYLVFINMYTSQVGFTIPDADEGYHWVLLADTQNYFEKDLNCWSEANASTVDTEFGVAAWSVVILKQVSDAPAIPDCEAPAITGTDNFTTSSSVSINCGTAGATIYYTTDGTVPSATNGTEYSGAFTITKTTTVKAIAVASGYNNSSVTSVKFTKNAPTCTKPTFTGDTTFTESSSITLSCTTSGATIYYTLDGSIPSSANGTLYSGSISISETKTLKAIAVLDGYEDSEILVQKFTLRTFSSKSGIMLQGFNWASAMRGSSFNKENPNPNWYKWYNVVTNLASDIKDTFEYMWCPPPSMTDTSSSEGYGPSQLNDLNNCYGSELELKAMINAISPTKAIADIVINHRAGTTSWADFTNPSWTEDYYSICSDDECFSSDSSPIKGNTNHGAADSGDTYGAYRDLDHTNTLVQQGIIDWMNNVLKPAGFVGWRYDYVKGYGAEYVGKYNAQTEAEFSVGEYWPTDAYNASGWGNTIKNWISGTEANGGQRSRAFDFALKGAMNSVFNDGASYSTLADSSNLIISQPSDAVTFVDNHDTGSTQGHWPVSADKVGIAYALILTHPGIPCVAWQHYFTYAESGSLDGESQYVASNVVAGTSKNLRQHIDKLIQLRKDMGIEYDSVRTTKQANDSGYAAQIDGTNGSVIVLIGSGYTPSDSSYTLFYSGTGFAIWVNDGKVHCASPVISFADGKCSISCTTSGATVMYSTDGTSYSTYTEEFSVTEGTTVYAYATKEDAEDSEVVNKLFAAETEYTITGSFPDYWGSAGDVMYAYIFGGTDGAQWVPASYSSNKFTFSTSYNFTTCIAVRMKSGTTSPSWDNKWNKSNDIVISGTTGTASSFE